MFIAEKSFLERDVAVLVSCSFRYSRDAQNQVRCAHSSCIVATSEDGLSGYCLWPDRAAYLRADEVSVLSFAHSCVFISGYR